MPCYGPLTAYYSKEVNPTGKRSLIFDRKASHSGVAIRVPCGQCIGCRLERSRQWAMRCMHEKRLHERSSFLTLTYGDEFLPPDGGLSVRDLQLFMKRLRKRKGEGVRFYACGEYGETTARPHYHVLLLNVDFDDRLHYSTAKRGERLYVSRELDDLWPQGLSVIGDVSFDSCAYVARYIMKKITGKGADAHYTVVDRFGVVHSLQPEFTVMSRRPGIGSGWFDNFGKHAYQFDSVVVNGREVRPPKFYDSRYELCDADHLALIKRKRRSKIVRADNTSRRRRVREVVALAQLQAKGRVL